MSQQNRGGNPKQNFPHPYVVRGDATPGALIEGGEGNGERNYDVLSLIAAEWLKLNPDATTITKGEVATEHKLSGSRWSKIQTIVKWIAIENKLYTLDGKLCDGEKFSSPVIYPGLKLDLPMRPPAQETAHVINPEQGGPCGKAAACLEKKRKIEEPRVEKPTPKPVGVIPVPPVVPPAPKPVPEKELTPHFTPRESARASEGATIRPGSVQWALETRAMVGDLDDGLSFAKEHWSLKNITPNKRVFKEKQSAETENFGIEGDKSGKNKLSRQDDDTMAPNFYLNGKKRLLADKGRPFTNGYVDSINEQGEMVRHDGLRAAWVHGGNYAVATKLGVVNVGYADKPVGGAIFNPSKQLSIFSDTARYGLAQSHAAIAEVNLGGKHNLIANQRSWINNVMESPDRINADTMLKVDQKELAKQLAAVEAATSVADKTKAATAALVALRDIKANPVIRAADAVTNGPLAESETAIKRFLVEQKLDVAAISTDAADLKKNPRFVPVMMSKEEKQYLLDHGVPEKRVSGVKPGEKSPAFQVLADEVFRVQNSVSLEIAQGRNNVLKEAEAIKAAKTTLETIAGSQPAIVAYADVLKRDRSTGVEMGQALSDILKNPQNYPLPKGVADDPKKYGLPKDAKDHPEKYRLDREAATKWVQEILGDTRSNVKKDPKNDNERAFDDVHHYGQTSRVPFAADKPFPVSRPDLIGAAAAAQFTKNPQLFTDFVQTITGPEVNKKGLSDGRRHSLALVHALGAESVKESTGIKENADAPGLSAVLGALKLDATAEKTFRNNVRDLTAYTESGAAGFSVKARETLDNTLVTEQNRARTGNVDLNRTFRELFTSSTSKELDSDRLAVEALKAHPGLARDVVLATMLRNPAALQPIEDHLKTLDKSLKGKLQEYDSLRDMIKDTRKAAEDYKKSGNEKDMKEAVEKFGRFFTKLEADADRAEALDAKDKTGKAQVPHNKSAQKSHAWSALMDGIGESDAMSAAMVETMGKHTVLRDAFLGATKDAVLIDNQTIGHVPGVKATRTNGDALYQSAFFTLPTDKKGHVDVNSGLLGLKHNQVTTNTAFINDVLKGNNDIAQSAALFVAAPVAAPKPAAAPHNTALLYAKLDKVSSQQVVRDKALTVLNSDAFAALDGTTLQASGKDGVLAVAQALAKANPALADGKPVAASSALYQAVAGLSKEGLLSSSAGTKAGTLQVSVSPLVKQAQAENAASNTKLVSAHQASIAASGEDDSVKALMSTIISSGAIGTLKPDANKVKAGGELGALARELKAQNANLFASADAIAVLEAVTALKEAGIISVTNAAGKVSVKVNAPLQAATPAVSEQSSQNTANLDAVAVTSGIHRVLTGGHEGLEHALTAKHAGGKDKHGKDKAEVANYTPAEQGQIRAQAAYLLGKDAFANLPTSLGANATALAISQALVANDKSLLDTKKLTNDSLIVKTVQAMMDGGVLESKGGQKVEVKGVALTEAQLKAAKEFEATMNASGIVSGNALGTNPAIFLGKVPEGQSAEATAAKAKEQLAAVITEKAKTNPLLQGNPAYSSPDAINKAAGALIDSGLISVVNKGGELVALPSQQGVGATEGVDGKLNLGMGLDTKVLLIALYPLIPVTGGGVVPGSPPVKPPVLSPNVLSVVKDVFTR